jgi:hypothetical protein
MAVVLMQGRSRLLGALPTLPGVKAMVHAMLPGPWGAAAIAEVLLGQVVSELSDHVQPRVGMG